MQKIADNHGRYILRLFDTFDTKFSFHHKWYEAWLLVINMVYASCLKNGQTT